MLPRGIVQRCFTRLRQLPPGKAILQVPVAVVASALQIPTLIAANRVLHEGKIRCLWFTTSVQELTSG